MAMGVSLPIPIYKKQNIFHQRCKEMLALLPLHHLPSGIQNFLSLDFSPGIFLEGMKFLNKDGGPWKR